MELSLKDSRLEAVVGAVDAVDLEAVAVAADFLHVGVEAVDVVALAIAGVDEAVAASLLGVEGVVVAPRAVAVDPGVVVGVGPKP